jgi:hypothetical protein
LTAIGSRFIRGMFIVLVSCSGRWTLVRQHRPFVTCLPEPSTGGTPGEIGLRG